MDATILKPLNYNYFPEHERLMEITKIKTNNSNNKLNSTNTSKSVDQRVYEYLKFHPVCASSEMVGTSIEELFIHNYPNKRSWECSRLSNFPQEVIIRLDTRSYMKYVLIRAKVNRPIHEVELFIGDGIQGNFNDANYRKVGTAKFINEEAQTIKVDGIGNYLKLVFIKASLKCLENPFGQVSLSQLKIFGKKINNYINYNTFEENKTQDLIDRILIDIGVPLNDPDYFVYDMNHEIAAVDEETKITLKDLMTILYGSDKNRDYEIMKKIKNDIKKIYFIGNEILNKQRQLEIAKSRNDYDTCIILRGELEELRKRRDNFDAIYETSRYEKMIIMKRPTTAELLEEEEYNLKIEREILERERMERERVELERKMKELEEKNKMALQKIKDDEENKQKQEPIKFPERKLERNTRSTNVDYVNQKIKKQEDKFVDELQYNQGDKDLEPYFAPLARNAGGNIPAPDLNLLKQALRKGILSVTGVRLFSALISENWKMREAAVKAWLEYIENPLISRYLNKTLPLFLASIEVTKYACEDKIIQIYLDGIKVLATALAPPVCGNDIDPNFIQKSIQFFIPKFIKKISELNLRSRDLTMTTLIAIFKHPALNIGDLIKGCLDIVERKDGITPDKQPWNVLLARLEIILHVLEEYGIDENCWDWYPVFTEMIIPSLFNQNPDCRMVAVELCVILYKLVGDDIKIIVNDVNNLKPNLKESINNRFDEVYLSNKREFEFNERSQEMMNKSKTLELKTENDANISNSKNLKKSSNLKKVNFDPKIVLNRHEM